MFSEGKRALKRITDRLKKALALSEYRYEKAKETLKDGKIAFENKSYKMAANRAYYAVLHGIRSLLILKGLDPVRVKLVSELKEQL